MASIVLEFAQFGDFDSFSVYRSTTSMQIESMPPPLATGLDKMYYVDNTIEGGNTYYYRVGVLRNSEELISSEVGYSVPSEDTGEATETFKFSTENYKSTTNALQLRITVDSASGDWSILRAGLLIADSTGFNASGIVRSETSDGTEIRLGNSQTPSVLEYEVVGNLNKIILTHTKGAGSPDGKVVVSNFCKNVNGYQFRLPNVNLQVPEYLPPNVNTGFRMFLTATLFNQDISMWNTSTLLSTESMFNEATLFNQDISGWNIKNSANATFMFYKASAFNQDLSLWCVTNLKQEPFYFSKEATKWTLPKPVWGTCPRGEV